MDRYRVAPTRPVFLSSAGQNGYRGLPPPSGAGRRSGEADELDIFAAERYFYAPDVVRGGSTAAVVVREAEEQLATSVVDDASQSGRTAASSEASWNSRSGLLPRDQPIGADRQQREKGYGGGGGASELYRRGGRKTGSGQRWGLFSRDCPCVGRKAVTVDVASEPQSPTTPRAHARYDGSPAMEESTIFKAKGLPSPTLIRETDQTMKIAPGSGAFHHLRASGNSIFGAAPPSNGGGASFAAFPPDVGHRVVSSGGFTFPVLGTGRGVIGTVEDPPRESLDVFRPIDEDSVLLADPPPALAASEGFPRAPAAVTVAMDEEAMSDASSDLFDLESFAASSSYPTTYRGRSSRRNSGDEDLDYAAAVAEPAVSECMYAPSEASVVWSVATAEGFAYDVASAASACCVDEFRFVPPQSAGHDGFTAAMSRSTGRRKGGGGGLLNSCRCEKAVSVGPTPVRVARPPPADPSKIGAGHGHGRHAAARFHHQQGRVHTPVRT